MAKKDKRSREELEQLLEIAEIENKRLAEKLHRMQIEMDRLWAEYNALPQWMRQLAKKRHGREWK